MNSVLNGRMELVSNRLRDGGEAKPRALRIPKDPLNSGLMAQDFPISLSNSSVGAGALTAFLVMEPSANTRIAKIAGRDLPAAAAISKATFWLRSRKRLKDPFECSLCSEPIVTQVRQGP